MMIPMRNALLVLALVFISGCVTDAPAIKNGLVLTMDANPAALFPGGTATITMDLENVGDKTLRNVSADVFETGMFEAGNCKKSFGDMEPQDFKTFACSLKAKKVDRTVDSTIWARAEFSSAISAVQTIDVLSQDEWEIRKKSGMATEGQKSFSFKDSNLEVVMDFSSAPVVISDKKNFVSFAIRNIGSGFIEKIGNSSVTIKGRNVELCDLQQDIFISGREFPRFSCAIKPAGTDSFITAEVSISINYDYEMRSSVSASIV